MWGVAGDPAAQRVGPYCASLASDLLAILKQDQRRYAGNVETTGGLRLIGIHLEQPGLSGKARGRRRELRRHGLARPAPRRPDIEKNWAVRHFQVTRKRRVIYINWRIQ